MRLLHTIAIVFSLSILPVWLTACGGSGGGSGGGSSPASTISGTVFTEAPGSEAGVTVKGFYSFSSDTTASVMTDANGSYTLTVQSNRSVSLQLSKPGHITLNSEDLALSPGSNETGYNFLYGTTADAQGVIDTARGATNILIADKGWIYARVVDPMDNEVPGVSITSTVTPEGEVYTLCDGSGSGGNVTVVDMGPPCLVPRDIMYGAYFDVVGTVEIEVSVPGIMKTAPIRLGEMTELVFFLP